MSERMSERMSAWLGERLVRLYPRAWRERYGEEFRTVLAEERLSACVVVDVALGALDARLHPERVLGRGIAVVHRLRGAEIAIFCAFIAFVVGGIGFQKMTEYDDFMDLAHSRLEVGLPFYVISYGSAALLLAILLGGLPIAFMALRQAWAARRWGVVALFAVPVVSFLALVAVFAVVAHAASLMPPRPADTPPGRDDVIHFGILAGAFCLAALASTAAVAVAIARSELPARVVRLAFVPAAGAALIMVLMCAAMLAWGLAVHADAPALFNGNDGLVATNTARSYFFQAGLMTLAALTALVAGITGLRARAAAAARVPSA
ncbi:MAG TPA: hypothetical protein VFY89_02355 [Ktedonobacterales bacterium]